MTRPYFTQQPLPYSPTSYKIKTALKLLEIGWVESRPESFVECGLSLLSAQISICPSSFPTRFHTFSVSYFLSTHKILKSCQQNFQILLSLNFVFLTWYNPGPPRCLLKIKDTRWAFILHRYYYLSFVPDLVSPQILSHYVLSCYVMSKGLKIVSTPFVMVALHLQFHISIISVWSSYIQKPVFKRRKQNSYFGDTLLAVPNPEYCWHNSAWGIWGFNNALRNMGRCFLGLKIRRKFKMKSVSGAGGWR